jgi:hypothetical protein
VQLVNVLLSVTEESDYLPGLLDSVINQNGVETQIHARADRLPVSDAVLGIFRQRGLELIEIGPHLGLPDAYLRLLSLGSHDCDYFAFADHDDLWDANKLRYACEALAEVDEKVPALWVCQIDTFGDLGNGSSSPRRRSLLNPSVGHALTQTIAPGCAMVWNRALQDLLCERLPKSGILMHDSWLYLVAASIGVVIVDKRPLVRYRLHEGNAVGLQTGWRRRFRRLQRAVGGVDPTLESQAAEALRCFGDLMEPRDRKMVETVAEGSILQRVNAVGPTGLRRDSSLETTALLARMMIPSSRMNSR